MLYDQRCPQTQAGSYLHLHLAAAPVVLIMNAPNYAALLGFAQGNLLELSSYATAQGPHEDKAPLNTKFNPAFQFAPPRDDMPTFRMTAGLPLVTVWPPHLRLSVPQFRCRLFCTHVGGSLPGGSTHPAWRMPPSDTVGHIGQRACCQSRKLQALATLPGRGMQAC